MDKPFHAYQGDESFIFASYAHGDEAIIYPELTWLQNLGINIWYDEGISPGAVWRDELAAAIRDSELFLLFITPMSSTSNNCLKELSFALEHEVPVLAIHLAKTEMSDGLQLSLGDRQAILKYELSQQDYEQKILMGLGNNTTANRQQTAAVPKRSRSTPLLVGVGIIAIAIMAGLIMQTDEESGLDPAPIGTSVTEPVATIPASNVALEASIAVLPFANMSNDPDQEFFSDGLSEDILNGLVKFSTIKVIARTSSFQFKDRNRDVREIGKRLAVTHVLEGSVRKVGNRIRVTAQLVTTTDGTHLWSEQYDRQLNDVFEVQDDITAAILGALNFHFTPWGIVQPPTTNMAAYEALLLGRHHFGRLQLDEAVAAFRQAVSLDPEYADAYASLAYTHRFYVWSHRASLKAKLPLMRDYTNKALALDPTHRGALKTRIIERFYVDRDYQGAIDEFHQQFLSYPNDMRGLGSYATLLKTLGRDELAISLWRRGTELNPLSPLSHFVLAGALRDAGRLEESGHSYRQAERLGLKGPEQLTINAMLLGDKTAVTEQLERDDWSNRNLQKLYRAFFAHSQGNSSSVETILAEIGSYPGPGPFIPAGIMLLKGNLEGTLDLFEQYMDASEYQTMLVARNLQPFTLLFPDLYEHPRYQAMLRKHRLDDDSIAKINVAPLPF